MGTIILVGGSMAGCQPEFEGDFRHRSTMQRSTNGLVLHDDGAAGHAGMLGTNCPFETDFGMVTGDYDLPGEDEEVQDVGSHVLGSNSVLLVQTSTLHVLNKNSGDYVTEEVDLPGVLSGRFSDDGVVAVVDAVIGCSVEWFGDDGSVSVVEIPRCSPNAFDVDPQTGTAYVGTVDGALEIVTPVGSVDADTGGDLLAWDPVAEATYVATLDGDTVEAVASDGSVRWSTSVQGAVQVLEPAGRHGAAAVMLEKANGTGLLVLLDGWTGDEISKLPTPSAAKGISFAGNGGSVAMVLDDETYFYGVYLK